MIKLKGLLAATVHIFVFLVPISAPDTLSAQGASTNCAGDVNGDQRIDILDLELVLHSWGESPVLGDATDDGRVDFLDLEVVLNYYGESCNEECVPPLGFYPIRDADEFQAIRENLEGNFFLCNDIDLDKTSLPYEPIGIPYTTYFNGILEGDGNTIKSPKLDGQGASLFAEIGETGVVRNLILDSPKIVVDSPFGSAALADRSSGLIDSVSITGQGWIRNTENFGAVSPLVSLSGGRIVNCTVGDGIVVEGRGPAAGLVSGVISNGTNKPGVEFSTSSATVIGGSGGGGIVGSVYEEDISTSNFFGSVTVSTTGPSGYCSSYEVGGIAGSFSNQVSALKRIRDCHNFGRVTTCGSRVGGIVGNMVGGMIERSSSQSTVTGGSTVGGIVGLLELGDNGGAVVR
ncbi:MAG: hypothetical protein KDD64_16290, partial [Bdellovibrionales bacterium]|nr:hypothetical protein [Bdellovibrionales bacterium]